MQQKIRAGRNRTIDLTASEESRYRKSLLKLAEPADLRAITNKTIWQDVNDAIRFLPESFVDLMIVDPPYNLQKTYNTNTFKKMDSRDYVSWVDSWMSKMLRVLKPDASIYVCCDWQSSFPIYEVLTRYFSVRNRITWEREKGRGSKTNWKNCSEDIWFATI